MATQTKNGKSSYKEIEFDYCVYGAKKFGGKATIYLHFGNASQTIQLELFVDFDTIDKAKEAIIKSAECWIDKNIR